MQWIYQFSQQRRSWLLLFVSALTLVLAALYFQHVMDLRPCIQCIYQRTAVMGILVASALPLIYNHYIVRILAYALWGYSAWQGLIAAQEHLDIIFATNPLFMSCEFVPNFPSFAPLHEWIPAVFGATGECNENSWQFLGMGMANWLEILFIAYLAVLAVVVCINIVYAVKGLTNKRA